MPKFPAAPNDAASVQQFLRNRAKLPHLHARQRANTITIESGPEDDPFSHAQLRRVAVSIWELHMPTHRGRWENAHVRGLLNDVLTTLVDDFGWTLEAIG
jgi:hypothetical protein